MKRLLLCFLFIAPVISYSQQPDTLIKKLDSLSRKTDSIGTQQNNTNPLAYTPTTGLNVSSFFILYGSNLKQGFTKPFHMTKRNWKEFGEFALVTGALFFADEPIQRFALALRKRNPVLRDVSGFITRFGGAYEAYTLVTLGVYGYGLKKKKMQTTTLLAVQSYMTGAVFEAVLKQISGRQRPFAYNPSQLEAEPTFKGPFAKLRDKEGRTINSSFPSGHSTLAFAAATVFALEYKDKPWVPILCYSSASLIAISRITENKHWVSDIVAGTALGYLTGKLVVNNYHRYAKIKSPKSQKGKMTATMGMQRGIVMPGLRYVFR